MPRRPPVSRILNDVPPTPAEAERPAAQTLTTTEAAARLGISPAAVRKAILAGRLAAVFTGGRWVLRLVDVAGYQTRDSKKGKAK